MSGVAPARAPGRLAFVIHDLNTWGGMERCTLEVARRLSHRWPVEIHAFTLDDPHWPSGWGQAVFRRVPPSPFSPEPLRTVWFYLHTTARLIRVRRPGSGRALVHASGACSLVSDVVQVHFVQAAWKARRDALPAHEAITPRMARASPTRQALLRRYYAGVVAFNAWTERLTFGRGKSYVAVSEGVAGELRRHLGLRAPIHVVRHGVDSTEFHPPGEAELLERETLRRELRIGESEVVALLVGALDRKGLDVAVRGLALLQPADRVRTRLLAIGGGDHTVFAGLARGLGVDDRLLLLPHQKGIARYFRAADLFLFPTLYEPFGMVILEGMACGLPPIVSRLAGAAELVSDGQSGILLDDPRDAGAIASAWRRLLDPDTRRAMGAAAREVALSRSWDRVASEYAAVIEPLLS